MKKAKFQDNYKMPAGSCIGHYNDQAKQCKNCRIVELCQQRHNRKIYPKNVKQIINLLDKQNNKSEK